MLAGGLGTRLRPLTYKRPKALMPILNKCLIDHVLSSLPKKIEMIVLAVGYKKDMLEKHIKAQNFEGKEIKLITEKKPLGTGGAIKNIEKYITGTFLAMNVDVLCSLNLNNFIKYHKKKKGIGTISIWEVEDPRPYGMIIFDDEMRIKEFKEKPRENEIISKFINAGTYVFEKDIFDFIEKDKEVSLEREVFPKIIGKGMYASKFSGYWIDIGNPKNYIYAHELLYKFFKIKKIFGKDVSIDKNCNILPPIVIGDGTVLKKGRIGPSVCIGRDAYIDEGCKIAKSVIFNFAKIGKNAQIHSSIIGEGAKVFKDIRITDRVIGDLERL
ncbi:MAG: NDP-sugar synthase [Candidatus Thermoplasmatota archaeon]